MAAPEMALPFFWIKVSGFSVQHKPLRGFSPLKSYT